MFRRLLTAGLSLAVLLSVLAWAARTEAKPPDLPLVDKDVLAPETPLAPVESSNPSPPNPFPPAAAPAAPAMATPLFFQLRPSTRRMMASCLLFGVHPLLTLTPTGDYLDFDADDAPVIPAVFTPPMLEEAPTGSLLIGIGVNSDAGLTGTIELNTPSVMSALGCGEMLKACLRLMPRQTSGAETQLYGEDYAPADPELALPLYSTHPEQKPEHCAGFHCEAQGFEAVEEPQDEKPEDLTGLPIEVLTGDAAVTPEPIRVAPKEIAPKDGAESVCPWMRQQHCASEQHAIPVAEADLSQDVLHNLEMLRLAHELLEKARELGRTGRVTEALALLNVAHDICPGNRLDDAVLQAAADLFVPYYCGSPSGGYGAEEQSEPPVEKTNAEPAEEAPPHSGAGKGQSRGTTEKEREIEQKISEPVSVHFQDEPLSQVIDDLRASQNLNIYVDRPALDAEEISLDHPVSVELDNVSLKSTLHLILKEVHLTYVIKDECLEITTERGARGKLRRVVYQVADLLEGDLHCPGAPARVDCKQPEEELIQLITSAVCPHDWSRNGGPGTVEIDLRTHSLVINQTADVQEQVVDLLNSLRRLQNPGGEEPEDRCSGFHLDVADTNQNVPDSVEALMRECHEAMEAGQIRKAAALARQAFACDPDQVAADPLVYKMHLAGDDAPPPVPITPCLPPVDPGTPAALDQLYRESFRSPTGGAEEQEPPAAGSGVAKPLRMSSGLEAVGSGKDGGAGQSCLEAWEAFLDAMRQSDSGSFEAGLSVDGFRMFGQFRRGGAVWHLSYKDGGLSVWASPNGGADPAPAEKTPPVDDSGD